MQRNIKSNNLATNTVPENEFKRLEKELAKEKEKSTQLEKDISILVRCRDAEISELNIIISLQNKLEANEALTNKPPMPRIDYTPMHRLNGAKEQLFTETKDHLSLSEFSVNNYMINNDIINQTKKQDQVSQKQIPSTQIRVKTPINSKPAATSIPRRVTNTNKTKLKQSNYQPIPTRITAIKQRKKAQKKSQPA